MDTSHSSNGYLVKRRGSIKLEIQTFTLQLTGLSLKRGRVIIFVLLVEDLIIICDHVL